MARYDYDQYDNRPPMDLDVLQKIAPEAKTIMLFYNNTPNRIAEIENMRARGLDVVHIPPPPPYDDWEQWSRLFGKDKRRVKRYINAFLRKIGRPELQAKP